MGQNLETIPHGEVQCLNPKSVISRQEVRCGADAVEMKGMQDLLGCQQEHVSSGRDLSCVLSMSGKGQTKRKREAASLLALFTGK